MSDYFTGEPDAPMTLNQVLRAGHDRALTLGIPGNDAAANARRAAVAESVMQEHTERENRAYRGASQSQEPRVPQPFATRLVAQLGGNLAEVVQHREFEWELKRDMEALPSDEYVRDENGEGWRTVYPTEDAVAGAASEQARLRDVYTRQFTAETARTRLLELEHDIANAPSQRDGELYVNEARNVIKSTAVGREDGPALEQAAKDLDQTAGRTGITSNVAADAHRQSLYAAWGTFERNPFEGWPTHDLNDDIAYFAEGSALNRDRVAELSSEERAAEAAAALGRVDEWSREGIHTAMTNAVSTAAVYEGHPETAALVAEVKSVYDTARSIPGASVDLRTFDEVLDAAVPDRAQQAAEPGNARDRIRANFAAQKSASFPQSAATQLNASAGQAQPAPTFRSGRGFGAPGRDSGVER